MKEGYVPKTYFGLEKIPKLALKLEKFQKVNFLKEKSSAEQKIQKMLRPEEISADPKILEIGKFGPTF